MRKFEYKAIPAPQQGTKARGVKSTQDRFALSMTDVLNEMAADGWEYVRAETLPCDERKGLTGTQTTYQNVLIFRKLEASSELLRLETTPQVSAAPLEVEPMEDVAELPDVPQAPAEPVPPRVTWDETGDNAAPPLGSARGD